MLSGFAYLYGQTAPAVSFEYDADGNMTARYVAGIAPSPKSAKAESVTKTVTKPEEEQKTKIYAAMLGEQTISIYPNPTTGNITLGVTLLDGRQKNFLRLYDALGRLQLTVQIRQELTLVEIKGPAGIYLMDIYLGDKTSRWKIIKE